MPESAAAAFEYFGEYMSSSGAASAAATVAAGAVASKAMSPNMPKMPPPPPALNAPDGSAAANSVAMRARGAAGLGGTNLTGPQGLITPASTAPKTLLG